MCASEWVCIILRAFQLVHSINTYIRAYCLDSPRFLLLLLLLVLLALALSLPPFFSIADDNFHFGGINRIKAIIVLFCIVNHLLRHFWITVQFPLYTPIQLHRIARVCVCVHVYLYMKGKCVKLNALFIKVYHANVYLSSDREREGSESHYRFKVLTFSAANKKNVCIQ